MIQCSNDFSDEINKLFILNHQHKTMMALENYLNLKKVYEQSFENKISNFDTNYRTKVLGLIVYFDMDFIIKNRSQ